MMYNEVNIDSSKMLLKRLTLLIIAILLISSFQFGCSKCPIPNYVDLKCSDNTCISEDVVVCGFLKNSKPFAKFYAEERNNMPNHIHWKSGWTLERFEARTDFSTNTTILWQIPLETNEVNAFILAHELCSYSERTKGFPILSSETHFDIIIDKLGLAFTDMLWTPLRDSNLGKYGFDLELEYKTRSSIYLAKMSILEDALGKMNMTEKGATDFMLACQVVELQLYWEDVLKKSGTSDFQTQFNQQYPNMTEKTYILKLSDKIFNEVRLRGYDTPEKMKSLYIFLISSVGYGEIIHLN